MKTRRMLCAIIALLCLTLGSCGKEGPTGPIGPQGPSGAAGPGTRTVHSGAVTSEARGSNGQVISVPELHLSDFPLVAVYLADNSGTWIMCNLVIYDPATGTYPVFESAFIDDGRITLFSVNGVQYKVIVVR